MADPVGTLASDRTTRSASPGRRALAERGGRAPGRPARRTLAAPTSTRSTTSASIPAKERARFRRYQAALPGPRRGLTPVSGTFGRRWRSRPSPCSAPAPAASPWASGSKRAGYDFTIYEKSDGVGGTWRDNTYPGAACDVPSHLYSFSFELNPWWSRTYATQPEILAYLERCTDQYGVRPARAHRHRDHRGAVGRRRPAVGAEPTPASASRADVLVSGLGHAQRARVPDIPGADRFRGRAFHSSRWDHSKSTRRRAGRGRSAPARAPIQYVPAIAPEVEHLTVFQRTPDLDHAAARQAVHPRASNAASPRAGRGAAAPLEDLVDVRAGAVPGRRTSSPSMQTELARSYLERKIADPELRAEAHARLPRRLQAAADLTRVVPGADPPERARSSPNRSSRSPSTASAPPTARSTRSTRSSTAPASRPTST